MTWLRPATAECGSPASTPATSGHLDPASGAVTQVPLGIGSRPHGVIVGADGTAWVTDGGLNAIVRVDGSTRAVKHYPLPDGRGNSNLNTATFDATGSLWFTGQAGIYGRLNPATGEMRVYDAPRGSGPYGITTTPVWPGLLRLACRQPYRPHRHHLRRGDRHRAADGGPGRAPRLDR